MPAGVLRRSTRAVSLSTRKVCGTPWGMAATPPGPSWNHAARLVRLAARLDDRILPRGPHRRTRAPLQPRTRRRPVRLQPLRACQRQDEVVRLPEGRLPVRIEL